MDKSTSTTCTDAGRRIHSASWKTALIICLAVVTAISMPGCGGCWNQDPIAQREENKKKKKKEKPKPDFEIGRVRTVPRDETENRNMVKAGHWISATQPMKANNYDFKADIDSAATNMGGTPIEIQNTRYQMTMSRPAGLPKGQVMQFESIFFIPDLPTRADGFTDSRVWLENSLRARQGGRELKTVKEPTVVMPDYQYFFVVLSNGADRYGHLKRMESISPPIVGEGDMMDTVFHYRVLLPKIDKRVPLPSQPLVWTSIAYVLWDGLNPDILSLEQQQAMLDWLHWGGQIIISGPGSLDSLRGSFLDEYLPVYGGEAVSLPATAFSELDTGWSIKNNRTKKTASLNIAVDKPPVGIQLAPHADAVPLPSTGNLVYERRVGAGRIVVTAFSPADRQIVNWGSFDSFFNACLLRRPRRQFQWSMEASEAVVEWADQTGYPSQLDARYVTGLRYFTRDGNTAAAKQPTWLVDSSQQDVAGWNDRSAAANVSRQSLDDASGISIPKAGFVLRVLVVYLVILVPLNWCVFRVFRRVEWAWIAAPLIAVVGAAVVVRLAQLDIGFARSRTEIAVLELNGGYRRAHLTRYTVLYTSLSTPYDLRFDDDSALAMPSPHLDEDNRRGIHDSIKTVHFRRDQNISLSGFQIASNSAGLVHSEQMHDVGGTLQLLGDDQAGWMVQNTTDLNLQDVAVLRKLSDGSVHLAWVGSLESARSSPLSFESTSATDVFCTQWTESPTCYSYERQQSDIFLRADTDQDKSLTREEVSGLTDLESQFVKMDVNRDAKLSALEVLEWCIQSREGQLTLGRLVELASEGSALRDGDVRLVGWVDQDLPGLTIRPQASQKEVRTFVLAHLRRGRLHLPQPDVNLKVEAERLPDPSELDEIEADVSYRQ